MNKTISRIMVSEDEPLIRRSEEYEKVVQSVDVGYTVLRSKSTITVVPDGLQAVKWIRKGLSNKEARFIKKTVEHFKRLPIPPRIRPFGGSTYYFQNYVTISQGIYPGYQEVDVSGAYWKTAKILGYLTDELYTEGLTVPKRCRLVALGALAKKVEVLRYEPPNYEMQIKEIQTPETSVFWDNITYSFSLVITQVAGLFAGRVLGFWVDAVFVDGAVVSQVMLAFQAAGYDVKLVPWQKIEVIEVEPGKLQIIRTNEDKVKELPVFEVGHGERSKSLKAAMEEMTELMNRHFVQK